MLFCRDLFPLEISCGSQCVAATLYNKATGKTVMFSKTPCNTVTVRKLQMLPHNYDTHLCVIFLSTCNGWRMGARVCGLTNNLTL